MELELGLAPPNSTDLMIEELLDSNSSSSISSIKGASYDQRSRPDTSLDDHHNALPLLLWSGQPDDHHSAVRPQKWRKLHLSDNDDDDEEIQEIEGWPPINSSRKEFMVNDHHGNHEALAEGGRNSCMYVKVKMEGVAIGRKIDLRLYHSYPSLTTALINMFAKYSEMNADYRILYKDREGDWMLIGDVPWEMFVESVQRMEILRSSK